MGSWSAGDAAKPIIPAARRREWNGDYACIHAPQKTGDEMQIGCGENEGVVAGLKATRF